MVIGAIVEDNNATWVNGDEFDNSLINSGAAYLFSIDADLIFVNGFE